MLPPVTTLYNSSPGWFSWFSTVADWFFMVADRFLWVFKVSGCFFHGSRWFLVFMVPGGSLWFFMIPGFAFKI